MYNTKYKLIRIYMYVYIICKSYICIYIRVRQRSLLVSIMCYVTLEDEPKLAWRALQLMQLMCNSRDQDVFQVLASGNMTYMRIMW